MVTHRISKAAGQNPQLKDSNEGLTRVNEDRARGSLAEFTNLQWVEKYAMSYLRPGSLLLLGGTSLTDFRLRIAQAHVRSDMLPSLWSHVAIVGEGQGKSWRLAEVSLTPPRGFGDVPAHNAIQARVLDANDAYNDSVRWPNIAVLSFPVDGEKVANAIITISKNRGSLDLSALVLAWLAFVWGSTNAPNPLLQEKGIPSAALTEAVMGLLGVELTPGLSSQSSCPEAIWQSVKWWHQFYEQTGAPAGTDQKGVSPSGIFLIRQPSAAIVEAKG